MILVMLETGVRVNEASNIMLSDVNKKMRLLTVRRGNTSVAVTTRKRVG